VESYRLYLIEPRDGHIYGARDIEAADDDAALRISAREARRPAELWAGPRRIAVLAPEGDRPTLLERTAHQA
jgi:hypothetical protein